MPFKVKMGLTIIVGLAALAGAFFMGHLGKTGPMIALMFLGPFTMGSLWVFPEVMKTAADNKPVTRRRTLEGQAR